MNPLGIFPDVFPGDTREQARHTRTAGLSCVHLRPPPELSAEACRAAADSFRSEGIQVAAVAGYVNLVNPDLARRETGLARIHRLIELCREFGTPYLATETGSLNPDSEWEDHPANHTEQAWQILLPILREAVRRCEDAGVTLLIEGYVHNVIATVADCRRLREEIPSPHLGFMLDPNNLFEEADMRDVPAHLGRIFRTIGPYAPVAHAKDVVYRDGRIDTPRAGTGKLDYSVFARLMRQYQPDAPVVLEHLRESEVTETVAFVWQYFPG
jgi:sugar phosphate isomerase/epimerase